MQNSEGDHVIAYSVKGKRFTPDFLNTGPGSAMPEPDIDNDLLWQEFKQGKEAAFIKIYSLHFQSLIDFGYQFNKDIQEVEDTIQDLFVDLRSRHSKLPPIKTSIKAYLFQALKYKLIDKSRKKRTLTLEDNFESFEVEVSFEQQIIIDQQLQEDLQSLHQAIQKLSPRKKEILYYLYYENLDYKEIQSVMGLESLKSTRNLVYKAIFSLKESLKILYFLMLPISS
ncbi:MAG: sigma-70 family RNA polymerase sigma factor [Cyclobacteriaceae bacterium]|nr:sigma-70 family RNA polymerase sigma factor [Cyclobacteriaceae bacterium]